MQLVLFCFTLGASLVAALLILGVKKLSEKVRIFTSIILSSDSIFGIGMPRAMTGLVLLSWLGCFIGVLIGYPTQISKYAANNVMTLNLAPH